VPLPGAFDSAKRFARRHGPKALLAFVVALGIRSCLATSGPVRDWVRRAAGDVADIHVPGAPCEFPMKTPADLNAAMSLLDFELDWDDDAVDDDDELLGASYASILGRPAVRLHIRREGGEEESVYVCKAGEMLRGMSSRSYSFDPYDVEVWEDDGLVYFGVEVDD